MVEMKRLILVIVIFLPFIKVFPQDLELSEKVIQEFQRGQLKAHAKNAAIQDQLWLTPFLRHAILHWEELTEDAQELLEPFVGRPAFSGDEEIFTSGNFAFHFTINSTITDENVDPADDNMNGVPDYIDTVAYVFNLVYELYHTTSFYSVPPPDGIQMNGAYYDIYISTYLNDLTGALGYTVPEGRSGDNPNSVSLVELYAKSSYVVICGDFDIEGTTLDFVIAHEYMHAVQFGYTMYMNTWLMESCATWTVDFAFPDYDDNFERLYDFFRDTDVSLNLDNGEADGDFDDHWYSSWIFIKYLTDHTGNEIVRSIYERCIPEANNAINAIDDELNVNWGISFNMMFEQFVIANAVMTSNSLFEPYTYVRASEYKTYINAHHAFDLESKINFSGNDIHFSSESDGNKRLMRLSADYFSFVTDRGFKIIFTPLNKSSEFDMMLVKTNADSFEIQEPEYVSGQGVIDVPDYHLWTGFIPVVYRIGSDVINDDSYQYNIRFTNAAISLFPNPASDYLYIRSGLNPVYTLVITDLTGKVVSMLTMTESDGRVDVRYLSNGIYLLQIFKDGRIMRTDKLIVSH
jgi:hypothetical protein